MNYLFSKEGIHEFPIVFTLIICNRDVIVRTLSRDNRVLRVVRCFSQAARTTVQHCMLGMGKENLHSQVKSTNLK